MNLLLNQKQIEYGIRTYMAERSDVLTVHVKVKEFIYGDNTVSSLVEIPHFPDYILDEREINEGIAMYLEEHHCFDSAYTKVILLPNDDLTVLEAVVKVKAAKVEGEV